MTTSNTVPSKLGNAHITELASQDELAQLRTSDRNTVLDFYAPWCAPCKALGTILDGMALELESYNVFVVRIDVDKFQTAASMYNVRSLPTLLFSKPTTTSKVPEIVGTYVGALTKSQIQQFLEKHFG